MKNQVEVFQNILRNQPLRLRVFAFTKLFSIFIFTLLFSSCENDMSEIHRLFSEEDTKKEVGTDVEILYSDSAVVKIKVKAPTLERYTNRTDPHEEFPDGLRIDFFDERGNATSKLTAKSGTRFEKLGQMIVRDSVVWESNNNERLETEELTWDDKLQKVHTNKYVIIRRPGEIIHGYGFESNQDFSNSKIRAIQGRIKMDE